MIKRIKLSKKVKIIPAKTKEDGRINW